MRSGGTYAPEGSVLDAHARPVEAPAEDPAVLQTAACCALCNDSHLSYNAGEPFVLCTQVHSRKKSTPE